MRPLTLRLLPALLAGGALACGGPADRSGPYGSAAAPTPGDSLSGHELAAVLGCGACHPGVPAPDVRMSVPSLDGLSDRWDAADLAAYLMDPVALRPGAIARMPDFHLDSAEAAAVTMHLLEDAGSPLARFRLARLGRAHPGATAERGGEIVRALNCAGCHPVAGRQPWAAGPPVGGMRERVRPGWVRGFLAKPSAVRPFGYHPGSGARMPDFRLSGPEADSLTAWLAGDPRPASGPAAPAASGATGAEPLSAFAARKAEGLLRDRLPCLGCHRLAGEGGRIGPSLDGAAARLRPDYLLRIITAPVRAAPGTIMPAPLEDSATIRLVSRYIQSRETAAAPERYLSLVENAPIRPDLTAAPEPPALYDRYCSSCHGVAGEGDGFNAAFLPARPTTHADPGHMSTRADATLYDGIHGGGHILGRSHRMPAFGATLTAAEIHGLVAHLRELCACIQPDWAEAR